jgi:anaerobic nitric oxide reductase transcription regulator
MNLQPFIDITEDLPRELSSSERYQRLLQAIQTAIPCDAIALLQLEGEQLVPLAFIGLQAEIQGRRFAVTQHPRLAHILGSRHPVRFASDSDLPDPYDGLVDNSETSLHVHDCMGVSIYIDEQPWGVITLDAMTAGQFDHVPPQVQQAAVALTRAAIKTAQRIHSLQRKLEHGHRANAEMIREQGPSQMIGDSPAFKVMINEIDIVANSDLTVLITGETGVGKELVARQLHLNSTRFDQPLVQINCAALPDNIVESELFGHVKGAFTGANQDRSGRFELANGGTLFLDEVGELPLPAQAKLLRALQEGEIQRVGSDTPIKVDVRIVAATNRDLGREVREGRFRADLFHRLSVYPLPVPALRERGQDVIALAGYFLERSQQQLGIIKLRLATECLAALQHYHWPGNIRELEHLLSRSALKAIAEQGREDIVTIQPRHLDLATAPSESTTAATAEQTTTNPSLSLRDATENFQRQLIEQALQKAEGNVAAAARAVQLDRSNLLRLIKRLGLKQ